LENSNEQLFNATLPNKFEKRILYKQRGILSFFSVANDSTFIIFVPFLSTANFHINYWFDVSLREKIARILEILLFDM